MMSSSQYSAVRSSLSLVYIACMSIILRASEQPQNIVHAVTQHDVISLWREAMKSSSVLLAKEPIDTTRTLDHLWIASPIGQSHLERLWQFAVIGDASLDQTMEYSKKLLSFLENTPDELLKFMMTQSSPEDQWGFAQQRTWQDIATYYEKEGEFISAIAALGNWQVSEPCGTGAGGSEVFRWVWLIRLRMKSGEDLADLKEYAWGT